MGKQYTLNFWFMANYGKLSKSNAWIIQKHVKILVLIFSNNIFLVSARCVLSFLCLKLVSEFSWQSIPSSRPLWRLQLTSLRMEHCLMAQYSIFDFMPITCNILQSTDYGHPMKPFFIEVQTFWAWADKLGEQILRHLRYFPSSYQHPFWYSESLVHVFHYSTIISTKN